MSSFKRSQRKYVKKAFGREGGTATMKKKSQLGTRMQGLYRNPNNPFEAWDSEGRPSLPDTIDDSPSPGISPPGALVDIDFETGRSSQSDLLLAEALHWTIE